MNPILLTPRAIWQARTGAFVEIYVAISCITAMSVAWATWPARLSQTGGDGAATVSFRRDRLSWSGIVALVLAALIFLAYIVVAMKWEAFADYDEAWYTLYSLRGINFGPPIWPSDGRFFPLGDQEFNLIRHFTTSAAGYHGLVLAQLLVISCILLFLDNGVSAKARAGLTALYLILPTTVFTFTGLVYQERNVVFWLACMLLFVKLFDHTRSTISAVAAALCAQNLIYYKETAFLLLLGFAIGRLIIRCRQGNRAGWDSSQLVDKRSRLDICLICVGLIFLLYYASVMFHHPNMQYANQYSSSWSLTVVYYLKFDPLAVALLGTALIRSYFVFRNSVEPEPFWDALAIGGVICYLGYIGLRPCRPYYLAPVDFIAILYVGRTVFRSWNLLSMWKKTAVSVAAICVLLQGISLSAFHVFERENMIQAKVELADVIAAQSRGRAGHVQRLFFPFADAYPLTEFASYLIYRGVHIEGESASSEALSNTVLVSAAFTKDGPCVDYRRFVCHAAGIPSPGDFVIGLPDDLESKAQMNRYRMGGTPLMIYNPRPSIPQWMGPVLNYLRLVSYRWRFTKLPDRWLRSFLVVWN